MARANVSANRARADERLTVLLVPAVALNAAAAMIVEIVAGRLIAPYFGMSLYTWTTVIGVVLAGLSLGHWLGGWLAERKLRPSDQMIGLAFLAAALATLIVLPLMNLVGTQLLQAGVSLALSITAAGFATFFLPSLVAGLVQPLATTLALEIEGRASGRIVGRMLAAGAFGSIVGTFLAGFVLISHLGSAGTIWSVAAVNAGIGATFLFQRRNRAATALALLLCAGSLAAIFARPVPGFAAPCQYESQYYCIRVDPADHLTGRPSRLLALDHLVHSINDEAEARLLSSPYIHLIDEIARQRFAERPFSAFFVGGGGYTLPRSWLARNAQSRIVVAEIDPLVSEIARAKLWFSLGPNTRIVTSDARVALRREDAGRRFDVIFGDAFHDISVPAHLVTDEFYALVRERLAPEGFYAVNVVDDPRSPRLLASVVRTLARHFGVIEVWVTPADIRGARRGTFVVYASSRPTGLASEHKATFGYPHFWVRVSTGSLKVESRGVVLSDDFAPIDRLLSGLWLYGN